MIALHHTNVVLSNFSATARTSVPASLRRSVYVHLYIVGMQTEANEEQLGTFGRAKAKVDELQGVIADSRRAGH
jgi:hypothetical protein